MLLLAAVVGVACAPPCVWNNPARLWPAYLYGFLACWLVSVGSDGTAGLGQFDGWTMGRGRPAVLSGRDAIDLARGNSVRADRRIHRTHLPVGERRRYEHTLPPGKAVYLEPVFFCQRAAGYFIVWLVLSWLLGVVSRLELPPASTPAMRRIGAITLVLLVPTATFAAFDWGMSLEPEWYSSIYGASVSAGGVLAAHALAVAGVTTIGAGTVGRNTASCRTGAGLAVE